MSPSPLLTTSPGPCLSPRHHHGVGLNAVLIGDPRGPDFGGQSPAFAQRHFEKCMVTGTLTFTLGPSIISGPMRLYRIYKRNVCLQRCKAGPDHDVASTPSSGRKPSVLCACCAASAPAHELAREPERQAQAAGIPGARPPLHAHTRPFLFYSSCPLVLSPTPSLSSPSAG